MLPPWFSQKKLKNALIWLPGRLAPYVPLFQVTSEVTEDALMSMARQWCAEYLLDEKKNKVWPYITVFGYDNDPRELYEIPEYMAMFRRMEKVGFLGLLNFNPPHDKRTFDPIGLGSFLIWAWLKGWGGLDGVDIEWSEFTDFINGQIAILESYIDPIDGQNKTSSRLGTLRKGMS